MGYKQLEEHSVISKEDTILNKTWSKGITQIFDEDMPGDEENSKKEGR